MTRSAAQRRRLRRRDAASAASPTHHAAAAGAESRRGGRAGLAPARTSGAMAPPSRVARLRPIRATYHRSLERTPRPSRGTRAARERRRARPPPARRDEAVGDFPPPRRATAAHEPVPGDHHRPVHRGEDGAPAWVTAPGASSSDADASAVAEEQNPSALLLLRPSRPRDDAGGPAAAPRALADDACCRSLPRPWPRAPRHSSPLRASSRRW